MRLAVLAVVCGCSYSPPAVGGDGAIEGDGTASLDMLIDDDDDDNDGVLDVDDNCPLLSNDQHDEDGDGRGDVCDPCPMFATGDDDDSDGDGIANACDPHPDRAGDVLVRFDGFGTAGGLPAGWTQVGGFPGDWVATQDELQLDTNTTSHQLHFDAGGPQATVHFAFTHSLPSGGIPAVAAMIDGDATFANALACSILTQASSGNLLAVQCVNDSCGTFGNNGSGQATNPVRIVATTESTLLDCSFTRGASAPNSFDSTGVTPSRNGVGLGVQSLRIAVPFIAVYRTP